MRESDPRRRRVSGNAVTFACAALLVLLAVVACPSGIQPPAVGTECMTTADCNVGRSCGDLQPCVIGRCVPDAAVVVPCDGYDTPVGDAPDAGDIAAD